MADKPYFPPPPSSDSADVFEGGKSALWSSPPHPMGRKLAFSDVQKHVGQSHPSLIRGTLQRSGRGLGSGWRRMGSKLIIVVVSSICKLSTYFAL